MLTAKHQNGFCLWPTATTDYSVRSSPWKGGAGDVVEEFVRGCRVAAVVPGLYLSAGDRKFPCWSSDDPIGKRVLHGDREGYFPVFMQQLRELLTRYGPLGVVWIEGANDPFGWDVQDPRTGAPIGVEHARAIHSLIRQLQPGALISSGFTPDIRGAGSDDGMAPYPLWNVVSQGDGPAHGVAPEAWGWMVSEARLRLRPSWFWSPGEESNLVPISTLLSAYRASVGRGANLLLNLTPDRSGMIPKEEEDRVLLLALQIRNRYGFPVAMIESPSLEGFPPTAELDLGRARTIDHLLLREDLRQGQRVQSYEVELLVNGAWKQIAAGLSIGQTKIDEFPAIQGSRVRLRITRSLAPPRLRRVSAFLGSESIRDLVPGG